MAIPPVPLRNHSRDATVYRSKQIKECERLGNSRLAIRINGRHASLEQERRNILEG